MYLVVSWKRKAGVRTIPRNGVVFKKKETIVEFFYMMHRESHTLPMLILKFPPLHPKAAGELPLTEPLIFHSLRMKVPEI